MDAESFDGIEQRLRKVIMSGSSQSTLPAIYGAAVSQDTKRLRPLSHAVEVCHGLASHSLCRRQHAATWCMPLLRDASCSRPCLGRHGK